MLHRLARHWWRRRLLDPRFAFLFDPPPDDDLVSLDCETTGLDPATADILSIAAIRIKGARILTSERLEVLVRHPRPIRHDGVLIHQLREVDMAEGVPVDEAIERVLRFVGSRPLLGYYLEFDVKMLNKYVRPRLGVPLPNRQIEVSALYYDHKTRHLPGAHVDLTFRAIRQELDLPELPAHDAFNDALLAAMMYLRLTGPGRGVRG
jgi:DNA polymerase III subunit epsilon